MRNLTQRPAMSAALACLCTCLLASCADWRVIGAVSVEVSEDGRHILYPESDNETVEMRIRREALAEAGQQEPCPASLYLELGSGTYVQAAVAEEQKRRHDRGRDPITGREETEFRIARFAELSDRRSDMGYGDASGFLAAWPDARKDDHGIIRPVTIDCNLTLRPEDIVHTRLRFVGPASSNLHLDCRCSDDQAGRCARIESPYTYQEMRAFHADGIHGGEPVTLDFVPANCGVTIIRETGDYVDGLGGVAPLCDPVRNVTVSRCEIHGRIRATSFTDPMAKYSSRRADHVERLRDSAAQHLTFEDVTIRGKLRTPLHLLPGVHHVTVRNSVIRGGHAYSTVYLPADGGFNWLINNDIWGQSGTWDLDVTEPSGGRREVIAIDASEHNRIVNNRFRRMPYGGIFLFRNCGERGMLRHRPPQYNQIVNNVFEFGGQWPSDPAVFIGSRDEIPIRINVPAGIGVKGYCYEDHAPDGSRYAGNDERWPWDTRVIPNSSESNGDWAGHNVVAQNAFVNYGRTGFTHPNSFIRLSAPAERLDSNHLTANRTGTDFAREVETQLRQRAGCAVMADRRFGYRPFVFHGEIVDMFWSTDAPVRLACDDALLCENNELVNAATGPCALNILDGGCSRSDDNEGCSAEVACPDGTFLAGAQAACNLEHGTVSGPQLETAWMNRVRVTRPSDDVSDGLCWANGTGTAEGQRRMPASSRDDVVFGCREHDRNGGDCEARVRLYCREGSRR